MKKIVCELCEGMQFDKEDLSAKDVEQAIQPKKLVE